MEIVQSYWQNYCNGDMKALSYIYKEYYNLLFNYGIKFLDDSDIIKDLIQDVFYKLCKHKKPADIMNVKVYLLSSLRNAIYDYYKSRHEYSSINDLEFTIPDNDKVFTMFFANDDNYLDKWQKVIAAINALPNRQKQILYLYYIKGLSHKEIASVLDISSQSSMNILYKTMKKIRIQLDIDYAELICVFLVIGSFLR